MAVHQAPQRMRPAVIQDRSTDSGCTTDWREGLPVLSGPSVTLRQLRPSDAASLFALLSSDEVSRFISTPPSSVEGVERFIEWTLQERSAGLHACFGIVPHGMEDAVGIIQVRQSDASFSTAEWGFALGSAYWGRGLFVQAAHLVVDFAFDVVGVHKLEARAAVKNGRANRALRKFGAVEEGVLGSFVRNGERLDQMLWTIVEADRDRLAPAAVVVH